MQNHTQEQWTKWIPIEGLSEKYYIDDILDNVEGFQLILRDEKVPNKKIQILFEIGIDAFKSIDESFSLRFLHCLNKEYGIDFITRWTFFKVINSKYAQHLCEESYGAVDPDYFSHFVIIAIDSIVDIITSYEPKVEFINFEK